MFLAFLWLATGVGILGYEYVNGPSGFRILGLGISTGWFFLVMSAWNFVRWYSTSAGREEREAMRVALEARQREGRRRERPSEPDPTFDFTDKPKDPPAH